MKTTTWAVAVAGMVATVALLGSAGCSSDDTATAEGPDPGENAAASAPTGGNGPDGGAGGADPCVPEPEELCDGRDNNCNEIVDEGCDCLGGAQRNCYSGADASLNVGECRGGKETCDEHGTYGTCDGEILPVDEACDGKDNDCNAKVDDGLGLTFCGEGICQKAVSFCKVGQEATCTPGTAAAQELCNGLDDNCDGSIDEGCACTGSATQACFPGTAATLGVGACQAGLQTCSGGAWGACEGAVLPSNELCNEVDDDCDGAVDDDPAVPGGAC